MKVSRLCRPLDSTFYRRKAGHIVGEGEGGGVGEGGREEGWENGGGVGEERREEGWGSRS